MTSDDRCLEVEARLSEAFLARRETDDADLSHIEGCRRCSATEAELSHLGAALDSPPAELSPVRARALLDAARSARVDAPVAVRSEAGPALPPGFARELWRLLFFAGLPLPLLAFWYAGLARFGGALLADWLPAYLAPAVGVVFAVAAASWLGLVYGSLPFVAHRRAVRRNEVTA